MKPYIKLRTAIMIAEKKQEGGGDDDWQPPADWLTVPEPGPLEICMLVWTDSFGITLYDHDTGNGGYGEDNYGSSYESVGAGGKGQGRCGKL